MDPNGRFKLANNRIIKYYKSITVRSIACMLQQGTQYLYVLFAALSLFQVPRPLLQKAEQHVQL